LTDTSQKQFNVGNLSTPQAGFSSLPVEKKSFFHQRAN